MAKTPAILLPSLERQLIALGERIRAARLRRNLTVNMVAERAGLSLPTLRMVERGSPTASLGAYAQVLLALNLASDLDLVARDDDLGRRLQDLNLPERVRPKKQLPQRRGEGE
jgi:transcriptional regulator with XRE-family HTH domain